jgi:hypothetical protein
MRTTTWFMAAAGAVALGFAMPAQAAPTGALTGQAEAAKEAGSPVEQVRHRCHWHRGHWHCPRHRHRHYGYEYGPSFYFYGGHRHRHHHHRRHNHW